MKTNWFNKPHRHISGGRGRKRKAQALIEMALLGTLLGMLLAGAVDLGRAYYTAVIVTNMAGEGAAYASIHPDRDQNFPNPPTSGSCSKYLVDTNNYIQNRVKRVALDRGLVVDSSRITAIAITPATCATRCSGNTITVRVTYVINDLFLPNLLGFRNITITKSASQRMVTDAGRGGCS